MNSYDSWLENSQQRNMLWQDAKATTKRWNIYLLHIGIVVENLNRHRFKLESKTRSAN